MRLLRILAALAAALAVQAALGRFLPSTTRWVDPMMLPVVWSAVVGSQRVGMLVGCAGGLLRDAWFEVGVFGLNGFKKTLIGYALAAVSSRVDFNREGGLVLAGLLGSLGDSVLDLILRDLLDRRDAAPELAEIAVRAVTTALAMWIVSLTIGRMRGGRPPRTM